MSTPRGGGRSGAGLRGLRPRLIFAFVLVATTAGAAAMMMTLIYVAATIPRLAGGTTGYVAKRVDLSASLACTVTVILVYIVLFARLATAQVLHPVRRLGEAARRLAAGDLGVRLEARGADEMSDLAQTFNEMAAALEDNVGELRRTEERARRFAADVSHELRTPLAAMMAVTDLLDERADDLDGDTATAARLVSRETRNLSRLVADLIEISRFDAGTATLKPAEVELAEAVADCLRVRGWSGVVTVEVPADLVVTVDPRRLDVILANLVGNALAHGAAPVTVRATTEPVGPAAPVGCPGSGTAGRWLSLTVGDRGPGLPPEVLPHVFERFYKADVARARSSGSGLGASIAWENARLHGGTLAAGNRPGGGALFTVRLPVPARGPVPEGAGRDPS